MCEVKMNQLESVAKMIQLDPYLVFQFDEMNQTGLMWAVKRNYVLMARYLLKH